MCHFYYCLPLSGTICYYPLICVVSATIPLCYYLLSSVTFCYYLLLSTSIYYYLLLSAIVLYYIYIYMIWYYRPWNPTSYIDLLLSATIYYYPLLSVITSCYRLLSCTTFWYMPLRIICNDLTLYVLICLPPGICYSPRWVSAIVYYCLLLPCVMNWAGAIGYHLAANICHSFPLSTITWYRLLSFDLIYYQLILLSARI